jgi:hypothetical protein
VKGGTQRLVGVSTVMLSVLATVVTTKCQLTLKGCGKAMENPNTWGPLEWKLDAVLDQYSKQVRSGAIGLSLVRVLADFIRERESHGRTNKD